MSERLYHDIMCPTLTKRGPCSCAPVIVADGSMNTTSNGGNQRPSELRGDPGAPRTLDAPSRDKSSSSVDLRACQALIEKYKEMRDTSVREMYKALDRGRDKDAHQRGGEVGTFNVVIADLEALLSTWGKA